MSTFKIYKELHLGYIKIYKDKLRALLYFSINSLIFNITTINLFHESDLRDFCEIFSFLSNNANHLVFPILLCCYHKWNYRTTLI